MTPMDVAPPATTTSSCDSLTARIFFTSCGQTSAERMIRGASIPKTTIMDKTRGLSLLQRVLLKPRQFFLSPLGFHATEKMAYLTLLSVHMHVCAHTNAGPGAQSEGADSRTPVAESRS